MTHQRDEYLINQALAYTIAIIERLPESSQEASSREDMRQLLEDRCPDPATRQFFIDNALHHLRPWMVPFEE